MGRCVPADAEAVSLQPMPSLGVQTQVRPACRGLQQPIHSSSPDRRACRPAENTWALLEAAILEINNHNASGLSFEELYRWATTAEARPTMRTLHCCTPSGCPACEGMIACTPEVGRSGISPQASNLMPVPCLCVITGWALQRPWASPETSLLRLRALHIGRTLQAAGQTLFRLLTSNACACDALL